MPLPLATEQQTRSPSKLLTEYYAAIILLLIALFAAAAFFLLRPNILRIKQTNVLIQSELVELKNQRTYLASLEQSVAAAQSIAQPALDRVQQALPNEIGTPALLMQFSAAAARNGVQIPSISFLESRQTIPSSGRTTATSTSIAPIDIDLSLGVGRYLDMKRFLADVEASLRLMDVVSITSGNPGPTGALTYHLQLRTYVFRMPIPRS